MVYKPNRDKIKAITMEIKIDPKTGKMTDSRGKPLPKIRPIPPHNPNDKLELTPLSQKRKKVKRIKKSNLRKRYL